jgi:hypothetical protein
VANFPILHYSRTQSVITQSTCEGELLAMNAGAIEGKLVQNILKESGLPATSILVTDSSSAKQVAHAQARTRSHAPLGHATVVATR